MSASFRSGGFEIGATVHHAHFGAGIVIESNDASTVGEFAGARKHLLNWSLGLDPEAAARAPSDKRRGQATQPIREADLDFVTANSFAAEPTPQREFLDERQLVPMHNVTILAGDGGTGKSLLAMQLGVSVSSGSPWLGRSVKTGPVLYFSAEDDKAETHIRLKEICGADGFDLASLTDLAITVMAGKDAILAVEVARSATMQATPLWRALSRTVATHKPILLILDNLADVFAGNENSRPLARQFIGMLRGLAIEHGCAVILLSHPSLSGMSSGTGTSGNTAWNNSVRSRLYLQRVFEEDGRTEADQCARVLKTMKANYGPTGGEVALRWESGRMVATEEPRSATGDPLAAASKAERVFLHLLRWHLQKNKFVSPNKSRAWAPSVFSAHPQSEGIRARQFEQAMTILLDQNRIEIRTHGSMAHRRQHIDFPLGQDIYEDAA